MFQTLSLGDASHMPLCNKFLQALPQLEIKNKLMGSSHYYLASGMVINICRIRCPNFQQYLTSDKLSTFLLDVILIRSDGNFCLKSKQKTVELSFSKHTRLKSGYLLQRIKRGCHFQIRIICNAPQFPQTPLNPMFFVQR